MSENSASSNEESISSGPRRLRLLSELYDEAPEVELFDEELLMVSVDEPSSYK